jgi:hypothetical protein
VTLLKATDVATRWQCDPGTVYRLARLGALASVRISPGGVRFNPAAIEEYERAHTVQVQPQTFDQWFDLRMQQVREGGNVRRDL